MSPATTPTVTRVHAERWDTVPGWFVVRVVEDYRARGIDVAPTLKRFGFDPAELRKDSVLDLDRATGWTEHVLERHPQPGLGLAFGSGLQLVDLGMVGLAMCCADTFGEAVGLWLRYGSLARPYQGTALETFDDGSMQLTVIERDPPVYGEPMRRYLNERWLAMWARVANTLLGPGRHLDEVQCGYPDPGVRDAYVETLGCLIRFDQPRTMLRFAPHVAAANTHNANRETRSLCETQCERLLETLRAGQGTTTLLRRQLMMSSPRSLPDLAQAARALGTSEGTLRRRLRDEGTSFTDVLHEVRMRLAIDYLRTTRIPVGEIAALLGYADESAFTRAFKRSHGTTALAYRRAPPPAF
ncbi:MAG TPA: AraC family transcriptional regulator ligand-binding domain-containing protein [Albitalea sp.]|nr:AraC family transcriptional regulator ligand-binding domain-containing protein [Albitalea sp.]